MDYKLIKSYDVNPQEMQYLDMMRQVKGHGQVKTDRTGTGTTSQFGKMMRFDLQQGIPILTTKKIHLKSIIHENIWFLAGDTNIKYLKDNGVTIWDEWADANGDLGPVYGKQWRRWEDTKMLSMEDDRAKIEKLIDQGYGVVAQFPSSFAYEGNTSAAATTVVLKKEYDQITEALNLIKNNPDSRRIIVNAWNVADVAGMALPPCHAMFQFYVSDMSLTERIAMHDAIGMKEEAEWRERGSKDWMEGMEFRTYRYGRSLWPVDDEEAHKALDIHTTIPRKKLSCMLYQRSADIFLGVPFNIVSYSMLVHMFAQQAGMAAGDFIWVGGDCHIYSNHTEQVELQLSREPRGMAQLVIKRKPDSIFDYKFEDFEVVGYDPHPAIKGPVAV